jgi:hypothetical protein
MKNRKSTVVQDVNRAPFLRLRGKWLAAAGFPTGTQTTVTVTPNGILITPVLP